MRAHGFDATDPKIAVIVQEQIASEISGVGFSLNPVTNNYDEAVFNANWGLGETVVSGVVTPDSFTVDKLTHNAEILIGSKEVSVWLKPDGGTEEKKNFKSSERTLGDSQIAELIRLIVRVEDLYNMPMDIEWAFAEGKLYLLQARPITTYVPLAPEMITPPGARKRLYFDISITAEAMTRPISFMGSSIFRRLVNTAGNILFLRDINEHIDTSIAHASDGRLHMVISTFLRVLGKKRVIRILSNIDPLTARVNSGARRAGIHANSFPIEVVTVRTFFEPSLYRDLCHSRKAQSHKSARNSSRKKA
jgi:hypothetical protein